jgi:hypothetical protein
MARMHHQAFVDFSEPDLQYDYSRQRAQSRTEALVAQPSGSKKRSPLPSVREIDAALQAKYGARRYREL